MLKLRILPLFALLLTAARPEPAVTVFDAVRIDDPTAVRSAAARPDALETRNAWGATPLLDAAAFGSLESLRMLIEAGADVNATTPTGASALILAMGDPAKTTLLVNAGANVNHASKSGRTPLLTAASQAGSVSAVRLLLSKGANVRVADMMGVTPLVAAAIANDRESIELLLDAGADVNQAAGDGMTPLHYAAGDGDAELVELLLDRGAKVNVANTSGGEVKHGLIALRGLTPLMLAATSAPANVVKELLDAGADVNATDVRGMTALMLAAASSKQDSRVFKLLLAAGADPNVVSHAGETALDWAAKYNNPEAMATLQKAGARRKAAGGPEKTSANPRPMDVVDGAAAALRVVQAAEASFFKASACISCHHQNVTQIAVATAQQSEIDFDEKAASESLQASASLWGSFAPGLLERLDPPGSPDTPTYSLLALAISGAPADSATDALFANIAAQQRKDGSWRLAGFSRAPQEDSHIFRTAAAVRALRPYAPEGRRAEWEERRERALAWLEEAKPRTTDDAIWRMAGLRWAGASDKRVEQAKRRLLSLQRADGGWGGGESLPSDAYSTGAALWALYQTGGVSPTDEVYRRGVEYLLSTQQPDGTWHVRSRSAKFQPYFESGFPYGGDQWISAAGTAWAAAALAPAASAGMVTD